MVFYTSEIFFWSKLIEGQLVFESRDQNILSATYIPAKRYQVIFNEIGQKFRENAILEKVKIIQTKNMARNSVKSLCKTGFFQSFFLKLSISLLGCVYSEIIFTKSPMWRVVKPPRKLIRIDGVVNEFH